MPPSYQPDVDLDCEGVRFLARLVLLIEELPDELDAIDTLDALDLSPFFVKIDVQGSELWVLEGGARTLEIHRPVLLVENPAIEAEVAFLERFGYVAYRFDGQRFRRGEGGSPNAFLMTPDKAALVASHIDG